MKVRKTGQKWQIVDDAGTVYGTYNNKEEADVALEGWLAYYAEETI